MNKLLIASILLFCPLTAFADTQDYIKGRVVLLKSNQLYFDLGQKDGVTSGQPFEIYDGKDVVASGKIAWADNDISKSDILDKKLIAGLRQPDRLTVKVRMYVAQTGTGGFLDVACFNEPHLEPASIMTPDDLMISRLIYRGLLTKDSDGTVVPDLAADYEIRDLTYTFYLRPDIVTHSGKTLTAYDIAYSLERLASSDKLTNYTCFAMEISGADRYRHDISNEISGILVIDSYTISITLKEPFPLFEEYLAGPGGYIIPRPGPISTNGMIDGTGIYRIKWRNADMLALEPVENAEYLPSLDSIRFVRFTSPEEASLAMEMGKVDIIPSIGTPLPRMHSQAEFVSTSAPSNGFAVLGINCARDFQRNENLGRALSFLIDRDAIIRVIMAGSASKPIFEIADKQEGIPLYPQLSEDSARIYLDSIGSAPRTLTLFIDSSYPILAKVARYIEGQLSRVKVKAVEKIIDFRTLDENTAVKAMDLYLTYYLPPCDDRDCVLGPLFNADLSGQTNYLFFKDNAIQTFLKSLQSEADPDRRDNLSLGVAQTVINHPAAVFLYRPNDAYVARSNISGISLYGTGCIDLRRATVVSIK